MRLEVVFARGGFAVEQVVFHQDEYSVIVRGGLVLWGALARVTTELFTRLGEANSQTNPTQGLPVVRVPVPVVEGEFPVLAFPDVRELLRLQFRDLRGGQGWRALAGAVDHHIGEIHGFCAVVYLYQHGSSGF